MLEVESPLKMVTRGARSFFGSGPWPLCLFERVFRLVRLLDGSSVMMDKVQKYLPDH